MSRQAKISIFSIILIYSVYLKYSNDSFFEIPQKKSTTSIPKKNDVNKNKSDSSKDFDTEKTKNNSDKKDKYRIRKYKVGNGYFHIKQGEVKDFLARFPKALNVRDLKYEDVGDFEDYEAIKFNVFNEFEIKNDLKWQKELKASLKTSFKKKRSFSYELYRDKKGIKGKVIDIYNYDYPDVFLLEKGAILSKVLLEYQYSGTTYFYMGYVNTGILNIKNNNAPTKEQRFQDDDGTPKLFDIDSPDYTEIPKSGFSPYNNYFGEGIYRETLNKVIITAPKKTHVVFILVDTYSKKRVRNEFIRKGETFTMTKIPNGTYDYMYFTGRNWSNEVYINKGKVRGGFKDYPSFSRNKENQDQMEFSRSKQGVYYTLKLSQIIAGNLKMLDTSESDFFE